MGFGGSRRLLADGAFSGSTGPSEDRQVALGTARLMNHSRDRSQHRLGLTAGGIALPGLLVACSGPDER